MTAKAPDPSLAFRLSTKMSICRLVAIGCALLAVRCQNHDYALAPTPCDEFCESRQRANCSGDDPEACVATCETNPSIADKGAGQVFSGCEAPGERLTQCFLHAQAGFYCRGSRTAWAKDVCAEEQRVLAGCAYFSTACAYFCGQEAEQCGHDLAWCTESCRHPARCETEFAALYNCLDSGAAPCAEDLRLSTRADCAEQRAIADTCIEANREYFGELPLGGDGGSFLESGDASGVGAPSSRDGGPE